MKVRIIKSNHSTYWYSHKLGEIYEVDDNKVFGCYAVSNDCEGRLIDIDDCEETNEENSRVITPMEAIKIIEEKYEFQFASNAWRTIREFIIASHEKKCRCTCVRHKTIGMPNVDTLVGEDCPCHSLETQTISQDKCAE